MTAACLDAGAVSVSPLALHLRPGVKEHFLAELRTTRPELADELGRRYGGAYLPRRQQDEIVAPVTRTVARLRPLSPPTRRWHPASAGTDAAEVVPGPAPAEQLRFGP